MKSDKIIFARNSSLFAKMCQEKMDRNICDKKRCRFCPVKSEYMKCDDVIEFIDKCKLGKMK